MRIKETYPSLKEAAANFSFLLARGYPRNTALDLVGNRYGLDEIGRRQSNPMTQTTAPMSAAIKVITGLVLVMTVVMLIAGMKVWGLLLGGAVLATVALFCYLYAPMAYELAGDRLTVRFRVSRKVFQAVTKCATLTARPPMGLRLWGNGGLFAATGIFWNQAYGVYRVYVTSARYQDYVLVETRTQKILISPENPENFVKAWASTAPAAPAPG